MGLLALVLALAGPAVAFRRPGARNGGVSRAV